MQDPKPPRTLILGTLIALIGISIAAISLTNSTLPSGIEIDTVGQPTIGYPKAAVHVVAFEEPKCVECKIFSNTIFPRINTNFIETNKILYTVIPVSFLPNSMPAAVALLCAYHQDKGAPNSDVFFEYLEHLYQNQPPEHTNWATVKKLQELAKEASPAIRLEKIKQCVDHEGHRSQIVKNTDYARN